MSFCLPGAAYAARTLLVPAQGALFGAYPGSGNASPAAFEAANVADRQLDLVVRYYDLDENQLAPGPWPVAADRALAPRVMAIDWTTQLHTGGYASWQDIANGVYDTANVIPQAQAVADYGLPILVGLTNEFDDPGTWQSYSGTGGAGYVAYFQHIVEVFRSYGATNAIFCWVITGSYNNSATAALYPGDSYVDWLGFDEYDPTLSKGSPTATYSPTMTYFAGSLMAGAGQGANKPVIIFETGVDQPPVNTDANIATWIGLLPTQLAALGTGSQLIKAWCWFNTGTYGDTPGDTAIVPGSNAADAMAIIGGSAFFTQT